MTETMNDRRGNGGSKPKLPPVFASPSRPEGVQEAAPPGRGPAAALVKLTSSAVFRTVAAAAAVGIPLGALITPLPLPDMAPVHLAQRPPVTCSSCGAFLNMYSDCNFEQGWWICLFCRERNSASGAMLIEHPQDCPELHSEAVDYTPGQPTGATAIASEVPLTVFVVDASCDANDLGLMRAALLEVVRDLPGETRVALISYSATLSVWHLNSAMQSSTSLPTADVISGAVELENRQLEALVDGIPRYCGHLHTCRHSVQASIKAFRPQHQQRQARARPRALGQALEAALVMARGPLTGGSSEEVAGMKPKQRKDRVLLIATGPSTLGPGTVDLDAIDEGHKSAPRKTTTAAAAQYFNWLSQTAESSGVSVDVFAVGSASVNVAQLAVVAQKSGGLLSLQEGFGPLFAAGLTAALGRRIGFNGGLDIKTSPGVVVKQIIGPCRPYEAAAASERRPNMRILAAVEHGLSVSALFQVVENLTAEFAYVQVIIGWHAMDGSVRERSVTRRIRLTLSPAVFLAAIDAAATGVLLAKRITWEGTRQRAASDREAAERLRLAVGGHLHHVAVRMGEQRDEGGGGWFRGPRSSWLLPPQLLPFAQVMFDLQRGRVLGDTAEHADQRAALQAAFVAAPLPLAIRIVSPALFLFQAGSFSPVEAVEIALAGGPVAVLDAGMFIVVSAGCASMRGAWSAEAAMAAGHGFAAGLAEGRVPQPHVHTVVPGHPDYRYFSATLAPVTGLTPGQQAEYFPKAAAHAAAASSEASSALGATDDPSLVTWALKYRVRLPPITDDNAARVALARLELPRGHLRSES